jgi:hypothetical protein
MDRHNDYEHATAKQCYVRLFPKWNQKLLGTEMYLGDNYWAMLEILAVQFPGKVPRG